MVKIKFLENHSIGRFTYFKVYGNTSILFWVLFIAFFFWNGVPKIPIIESADRFLSILCHSIKKKLNTTLFDLYKLLWSINNIQ